MPRRIQIVSNTNKPGKLGVRCNDSVHETVHDAVMLSAYVFVEKMTAKNINGPAAKACFGNGFISMDDHFAAINKLVFRYIKLHARLTFDWYDQRGVRYWPD